MAEEEGKQEDKFEFTAEGEVIRYFSLDQARVLAIEYAHENVEFYGRKHSGISLAWELHSAKETEDYYEINLYWRPSGRFAGAPGLEQFTYDKLGNLIIRQLLAEPVTQLETKVSGPNVVPRTTEGIQILVADEVWIATALLHRENPNRAAFEVSEIVGRVKRENIYGGVRPGIYAHANAHCVANRRPAPNRLRMLYETADGLRRLFKPSDDYHPDRHGSKAVPNIQQIPGAYQELITWHELAFG